MQIPDDIRALTNRQDRMVVQQQKIWNHLVKHTRHTIVSLETHGGLHCHIGLIFDTGFYTDKSDPYKIKDYLDALRVSLICYFLKDDIKFPGN
jgi:hypothetical protein